MQTCIGMCQLQSPNLCSRAIPISLKGLRKTLQSQLQVEACKSQIERVAERAIEDWVSGLSLVQLPEETLAHLRNPYTGPWQPCPTACRTCGRLLFTELHDLVFIKNVTGTNTCVEKGDLQAVERRCTASLSKRSPVLHDLLAASGKVPIARWMLMNGFREILAGYDADVREQAAGNMGAHLPLILATLWR